MNAGPAAHARRLLLVTYYFGQGGAVGGLRWAGIAKYLTRLGWKVLVVTAGAGTNGTSPGVEVESCQRLWTAGDACRLVRGLAVKRWPGRAASGRAAPSPPGLACRRPSLGREIAALLTYPDEARGWILRAALRARRAMLAFRPQVVVSSGPPHAAHLAAGLAGAGQGTRWFIDLRDPWSGPFPPAWESQSIAGTRVFRAISSRLERRTIRAAHGVITNTRQLAEALAVRYPRVSVAHVPNGVDPELLPEPAGAPFPGLSIAYTGTLYIGRDLGPVLRALAVFLGRHPDAAAAGTKLRVAGEAETAHAQTFRHAVAAAGVEPFVEVLGRLPRDRALEVLGRSCLAVVLAQDQPLQIPAKLYEAVALGVPTLVVAPATSAAAVEGRRLGATVCDAGDERGMACLLERLWCDGAAGRAPCAVPVTYEAIAPLVDRLFRQPAQRSDR